MRKQEYNKVEITSGEDIFDVKVKINGKDIAKEIIGFEFKLIAGEYPQLIAYYPVNPIFTVTLGVESIEYIDISMVLKRSNFN